MDPDKKKLLTKHEKGLDIWMDANTTFVANNKEMGFGPHTYPKIN